MEACSLATVSSAPGFKQWNQTAECEVNKIFQYRFISITRKGCVGTRLCLTWPSPIHYHPAVLRGVLYQPRAVDFWEVSRLVFHLNLYGSIGFLTCISVQRYLGVVHPMRMLGRWKMRHLALIVPLVWALLLVQTVADLHFTKTSADSTQFLTPFLLIIGCYCQIAVVLSKNHRLDKGVKERSRNLAITIMLLFSVCFAPYHVLRYLNLMSRYFQLKGLCTRNNRSIDLLYQIARGVTWLNCCIDPFIYFLARGGMVAKMKRLTVKWGFFSAVPGEPIIQFSKGNCSSVKYRLRRKHACKALDHGSIALMAVPDLDLVKPQAGKSLLKTNCNTNYFQMNAFTDYIFIIWLA
ncbi:LOW QUALITY PROTEIN: P2Y purinoceptor 1 [Narcine bancroftii]|uniref:LOW QUALITY PROTEIN: P2Y purinoceptor 1 n=1 Tax=Narcine bancroftii TaxID=1343680 RepID=UPI003831433B